MRRDSADSATGVRKRELGIVWRTARNLGSPRQYSAGAQSGAQCCFSLLDFDATSPCRGQCRAQGGDRATYHISRRRLDTQRYRLESRVVDCYSRWGTRASALCKQIRHAHRHFSAPGINAPRCGKPKALLKLVLIAPSSTYWNSAHPWASPLRGRRPRWRWIGSPTDLVRAPTPSAARGPAGRSRTVHRLRGILFVVADTADKIADSGYQAHLRPLVL
jgi:hypothetical protein